MDLTDCLSDNNNSDTDGYKLLSHNFLNKSSINPNLNNENIKYRQNSCFYLKDYNKYHYRQLQRKIISPVEMIKKNKEKEQEVLISLGDEQNNKSNKKALKFVEFVLESNLSSKRISFSRENNTNNERKSRNKTPNNELFSCTNNINNNLILSKKINIITKEEKNTQNPNKTPKLKNQIFPLNNINKFFTNIKCANYTNKTKPISRERIYSSNEAYSRKEKLIKNTPNFLPISSDAYKKLFNAKNPKPNFSNEFKSEIKNEFDKNINNLYKLKNIRLINNPSKNSVISDISRSENFPPFNDIVEKLFENDNKNNKKNLDKILKLRKKSELNSFPMKKIMETKLKNPFIKDKISVEKITNKNLKKFKSFDAYKNLTKKYGIDSDNNSKDIKEMYKINNFNNFNNNFTTKNFNLKKFSLKSN